MTIQFRTKEELKTSARTDVRNELDGSNPFIKNHWLSAMIVAFAFLVFDFYEQLKEALKQFFWDTSELPYLSRWTAIFNVQKKAASQATGNVVAEGIPSSNIPDEYNLSVNGIQYKTQASATIQNQVFSVTSLTRFGSTVTATTASDHGQATGVTALMSGAVETDYNGSFPIQVISPTSFTYQIEGTPTSPATGTIIASFDTALVPIQADDVFGSQTNQDEGTPLTFDTPLAGVNETSFVDFEGLTGGSNQETTEDNRIRFLDRVQNPVANFNVAAIRQQVLSVPGNTRAFITPNSPENWEVTIYFTRDNDGIIPTAPDAVTTKDAVLEIKPANVSDSSVLVNDPALTGKVVNFTFATISPNTTSMQSAINANLDVFFEERTEVGKDLSENEYISAIQNTVDTETGEILSSFSLTTPSGNVSVAAAEIPVKGTVSFP